jgi:hypothetical protein
VVKRINHGGMENMEKHRENLSGLSALVVKKINHGEHGETQRKP